MGGHEHREGHGRSRAGAWEGFEKLKQALEGLATAKGVSQSRIGAVAKLAAHYSKFYKHVVHDIEVFLWKAEVEHRLAGLYAIDAIIRQAHAKNGPKDVYVKRFLIRLADTIAAVKKVPEESQLKVRHVIEEWQKRGVYSTKQIEDAGGREYLFKGQEEQSENVTPRASPGKLASLLSIIKQKKGEQEHPGDQQSRPPFNDSYTRDQRQGDKGGAYNQRSYDERRTNDQRYESSDTGGIMGDAPGRQNASPYEQGGMQRSPFSGSDDRRSPALLTEKMNLTSPRDDLPCMVNQLEAAGNHRRAHCQSAPTAPPQGYPGSFTSASSPYGTTAGSTFMNQAPTYPSGGDQGRSRIPGGAPVLSSPGSLSQSYGGVVAASAPGPSPKVLADDDDGDTVEPEFTLEYDDDD
uniref:CID domain-containing protein n=1 Tax=Phytophthora ramorum TaxID=164328 RepID=H3GR17_PHYRM